MEEQKSNKLALPGAVLIVGALIALSVFVERTPIAVETNSKLSSSTEAVLTDGGNILPLDVQNKMLETLVSSGVIDPGKLSQVTELNLLWAFGLANKNQVLESGPITDLRYGGPANMASVGGWTVAMGSAMNHYNKHVLVTLTPEQQALVEKLAKGIYRPCCNNSTYFPDCNHGMAMLGLLEYLAANGATEEQMWNAAVAANVSWFPNQYQTIAQYFKEQNMDLKDMSPQELLGKEYSSSSGFARIASQVKTPLNQQGGAGCGVGAAQPASLPKKQSGCGV